MRISEMRQKTVDYMKAMSRIFWTPAGDMDLTGCRKDYYLFSGVRYRGLPYVNQMDCSLEEFRSWLREDVYVGPDTALDCIGVDCSSAVLAAWGRIASSFDYVWSKPMMPYHDGALPVGGYLVPEGAASSDQVVAANGEQAMYRAYAALQPADAVITYTWHGHVRMAAEPPAVLREPDGSISGMSFLVTHEICSVYSKFPDYETCWKTDTRYYFKELLRTGYLPVTCRELAEGRAEPPDIRLTAENTARSVTENGGFAGEAVSNYRIYQVRAELLDRSGGRLWQTARYPLNTVDLKMVSKRYDLTQLNAAIPFGRLAEGDYTLTLRLHAADAWRPVLCIPFHYRRNDHV